MLDSLQVENIPEVHTGASELIPRSSRTRLMTCPFSAEQIQVDSKKCQVQRRRRQNTRNAVCIAFPLACFLLLAGVRAANAQCYTFSSGSAVSLTVDITNLPPPSMPVEGIYQYSSSSGLTGTVSLTVGQATYTSTSSPPADLVITVSSSASTNFSTFELDSGFISANNAVVGAGVSLNWTGNFFPAGLLPAALPPIQPSSDSTMPVIVGSADTNYTPTAVNSCSLPYKLTISASPVAGGSVTPPSGESFEPGAVVPIGATANSGYLFTGWGGSVANASSAATTVTMNGPQTVIADFAPLGSQPFFSGEVFVGDGIYFLQLPDHILFGYYGYLSSSILYHQDMGYEAFVPSAGGSIYFYDFASGHWLYTSPSLFPYLYDFALKAWIYYFPSTANPGHYSTNPRYFSNLTTGQIFTM